MTVHVGPHQLTPRQVRAIALLAQGETAKAAAEAVKVSEATMVEWRKLPAFAATLNRLKRDALDAARTRLQAATTTAATTLADLAENAPNPETRRRAALDILSLAGVRPETVGPTDPATLRARQKEARAWDDLMKELTAGEACPPLPG